jgi:asparagine synthase (glutamine-hydrolysing)
MCGIVGAVSRSPEPGTLVERLPLAIAALGHRGPDGQGQLVVPHGAFGHARLSIIDLSEAASQPMTAAGGEVRMVFNGEIYNYKALYAEHLSDHPDVNPNSDTSVLLGMYLRYGADMLPMLNGMFAFAIHDSRHQKLLIARDRFGEKPLFYVATPEMLVFGSECRAIRALVGRQTGGIDPLAIQYYLHMGSVPAPFTIFKDVRALMPAHYAVIDVRTPDRVEPQCYWRMGQTCRDEDYRGLTIEQARESTGERLVEAVRSRLVSDVPVGLFLSGGIDSGAISSLTDTIGHGQMRGVIVDFIEDGYSEYRLGKLTADRFGIDVSRAEVLATDFERYLDGFFRVSDQPTSDGFNTYIVSEAAQRIGGKVWLSGVGGDELFGGYPFFDRIDRLMQGARAMRWLPLASRLSAQGWLNMRTRRALTLGVPGEPAVRAYQVARSPLPVSEVNTLVRGAEMRLRPDFADALIGLQVPEGDSFQIANSLESNLYMSNQLLRDMDNFSMAHSIELRAPFLDHRLFDYVYGLPAALKRQGLGKKPLLTSSLPQPLPDEVAHGPKRGFTFPLEVWIREHFESHFIEVLGDSHIAEFLDRDAVQELWSRYLSGQTHWSVVWNLYALARWLKEHA